MEENKGTSPPAHVPGVKKGEERAKEQGKEPTDARKSTSVNPEDRNPKDPDSPKMPPA